MGYVDPYANRNAVLAQLAGQPRPSLMPVGTPVPLDQTNRSGITDPAKFAQIDFDALGNRDYLKKMKGGAGWDMINGPAPGGTHYQADGSLHRDSAWDRIDQALPQIGLAAATGGFSTAGGAGALAARQAVSQGTGMLVRPGSQSAGDPSAPDRYGQPGGWITGPNGQVISVGGQPTDPRIRTLAGGTNATGTQPSEASTGAASTQGGTGPTSTAPANLG